ncbi:MULTISPECIES: cysteine synthase family protein [Leptolyngbya]|nr:MULTISPECIES: cysteine synthase family protein [Leptolyngbya]MBD2372977.1 cysteine synthase family protein [Leptolyngbya sp. FACHB-238]MBD2397270.1 cysteine synthase family protein [Leptolyngbya sp. FACHB-239]MBD2403924.1 cysteine synthase family protein [Leptolyngbya sp. FACHB-402]ULP33223.1 cysteine synthase family protein [Leptolyngbya boryana IU 594]
MTQTHLFTSQPSKTLPPNRSFLVPSPLFPDVTDALGMVPIVRLNRMHSLCQQHDFYLKLESCNPGGSIKEKNAAYLIRDAEQQGLLHPGGTIVESSSGNFGIGLAIVGAARGYRVMIVIDTKTSPTIRRMLQAYGAELVEVPLSAADAQGSMQVARMQKAQALASEIPGAWYPCQHQNPTNPNAHACFTAREIEAAFQGAPDAIVIGISTAGQLSGIGRFFKQRYPKTRVIGVDVAGSAIFGTPRHPYKMTGLGLSFIPPNFDPQMLDAAYCITDQIAFSVCHTLARQEGLLLGASTGAIVAAALADAQQFATPQRMLLLNPDRGDRYLETMYNTDWLMQQSITLLQGTELTQTIQSLQSIPLTVVRRSEVA